MERFARKAHSTRSEFISIERPFSNFEFIESRFWGIDTLRRLLSQVRCLEGKTMVVEIVTEAQDLREENEDIQKRYPDFAGSICQRLSFFSRKIANASALANVPESDFLGYAIIKSDTVPPLFNSPQHRVLESVIKPSCRPNNFIRGGQRWTCMVAGHEFSVTGYLYAQQNDMTNVCAHVALRTVAARFHKGGDMSYREMNELLGIDHVNKKAGGTDGEGLSSEEMVKVLESAGARCFVGEFTNPQNPPVAPFQRFIYGSVESGYPAIIFFGTNQGRQSFHAIPVFGHTFNEDAWGPLADQSYFKLGSGTRYIPSDSWLSMFIAHDDNWGSNLCIPKHYLQTKRLNSTANGNQQPDSESVAYVIGTIPKAAQVMPLAAEAIGADYLFTILQQMPAASKSWVHRLRTSTLSKQLILRAILISGREYTKHLESVRDWEHKPIDGAMISALSGVLTNELLWMVELSVPELFPANKRKIGEVLIRAQQPVSHLQNMDSFVLARLPASFVLFGGMKKGKPQFHFVPSGVESHVELVHCEELDAPTR
jgi:hypothetical protein